MLNFQRLYNLAGWCGQKIFAARPIRPDRRIPGRFEMLERRDLLTGFIDFNPTTGVVSIQGSEINEVSQVAYFSGTQISVSLTGVPSEVYETSQVSGIVFRGEAGNDVFSNSTSIDSSAYGGTGRDRLTGGSGNDFLSGQAGFDHLVGNDGIDRIYGGYGDDYVHGGLQADEIFGGAGDDRITGAPGNDRIFGEDGVDHLFGYYGDDRINGGSGNDIIDGQQGDDRLFGESGDDDLTGGDGADYLHGGDDNDTISAGLGDDTASGGYGDDTILGDAGDDLVFGYFGDDRIEGGDGVDTLFGDDGNDLLYGDGGVDELHGGNGRDGLYGGGLSSADSLFGEGGADRLLVQNGDSIQDLTAADAELVFVDQTSVWTDKEIQVMDEGFVQLHDRTQNTALLRDSLGSDPLTFYKYSYLNGAAGINSLQWSSWTECDQSGCQTYYDYDREIQIVDWDESSTWYNNQFAQVVIHEIAHNWDSVMEITEVLPQSTSWDQFIAISDWRATNPGSGFTQSLDGQWWYDSSADFAENYGRTNPNEDMATVFEYYFGSGLTSPNSGLQLKLDVLDSLFDTLM